MVNNPERQPLGFTHRCKDGPQSFEGNVLRKTGDYCLIQPDRQFFVQLVKFAPGKDLADWIAFHKPMNDKRHAMGIHEVATFVTWGRYDLIVVWYANSLKDYNEFLASWINGKDSPVTSDTHVVASAMTHY